MDPLSERDLDHELEMTLRELDTIAGKARKLYAALGKRTVRGTDEDKVVTAIANGNGEIVALEFGDSALKYPTRLGAQLTVAITRARKTAHALTEKANAKYLSELPTIAEIEALVLSSAKPVDYHDIDYVGPPHMRNKIAEEREHLFKILQAKEEFKARRIRREIGENAGLVEIDLAGTYLRMVIDPDAPRLVGVDRLARQIIESLQAAESLADRIRQEKLKR